MEPHEQGSYTDLYQLELNNLFRSVCTYFPNLTTDLPTITELDIVTMAYFAITELRFHADNLQKRTADESRAKTELDPIALNKIIAKVTSSSSSSTSRNRCKVKKPRRRKGDAKFGAIASCSSCDVPPLLPDSVGGDGEEQIRDFSTGIMNPVEYSDSFLDALLKIENED